MCILSPVCHTYRELNACKRSFWPCLQAPWSPEICGIPCFSFQAFCTLTQQTSAGTHPCPAGLTKERSSRKKPTWLYSFTSTYRLAWIPSDQGIAPQQLRVTMKRDSHCHGLRHNAAMDCGTVGWNKQGLTQKSWMASCILLYRITRLLQHLQHHCHCSRQQKQEAEEE